MRAVMVSLVVFLVALGSGAVEVERVLALVNGVPILASDVELAEIAGLVPRLASEDEEAYRKAVLEALVALELRYQDLTGARVEHRLTYDWQRAWQRVVNHHGGEESLLNKLREAGLSQEDLARLVRRAALVEAYVAKWFAPLVRVSQEELETYYREEFLPRWPSQENPPPSLAQVRSQLEPLVRERKLLADIERWTQELERRGEVIRYRR